jgi:hypothetical protein
MNNSASNEMGIRKAMFILGSLILLGLALMTAACTGETTSGASQVRINSGFGGSSAGTGQGGSIAVTIQQRNTVD